MSKRYVIRENNGITHFIIIDPDTETVTSECVDNEEPHNWQYMLEDNKQATLALKYLEQYLNKALYFELSEDEFYKARITLKYEKNLLG